LLATATRAAGLLAELDEAAIDATLERLRCPSISVNKLRSCLRTLDPLLCDDKNWAYAVRMGVYDVVVAGMRTHAADAAIQRKGCAWLRRMSHVKAEERASGGHATTADIREPPP
jgi:hypothetical protein